jgi:carbon storage regulator
MTVILPGIAAGLTKGVPPHPLNNSVGTRQPNDTNSPQQQSNSRKNQMLVLSRKVGEKLVIDGNITVEVVRIQGNRITLGLVAPADVKILRGELHQMQAKPQTTELVVEDGLLVAC